MPPVARLFGPDKTEIVDTESWFLHAPPEGGTAKWRDGYSAKEQAKAWSRSGSLAVPDELWSAMSDLVLGGADEIYARPEHVTRLDSYSRARQHDLFACVRRKGETVLVVGVEAKACETFDGVVADRATAAAPSKKRARCNLLSAALFGREVLDEETGAVLDEGLSRHGYQLWTAAVGTIIEAQQRGVGQALLLVQQFVPSGVAEATRAGDARDWASALTANAEAFDEFAAEIRAAGSKSHETESVRSGTQLHVAKVESVISG
jgi:hypothetical protein